MEGCWALVALRLARSMLVCLWLDEKTALRYLGLGDQKLVRRIDVDVKVVYWSGTGTLVTDDSSSMRILLKLSLAPFLRRRPLRYLPSHNRVYLAQKDLQVFYCSLSFVPLRVCSRVRQTRLRRVRSERGFDSALSLGDPDLTPDTARGAPAAEAAFNWKFLEEKGQNNLVFATLLQIGDTKGCVDLLANTLRVPEAALFARTYAPSLVPSTAKAWKAEPVQKGGPEIRGHHVSDYEEVLTGAEDGNEEDGEEYDEDDDEEDSMTRFRKRRRTKKKTIGPVPLLTASITSDVDHPNQFHSDTGEAREFSCKFSPLFEREHCQTYQRLAFSGADESQICTTEDELANHCIMWIASLVLHYPLQHWYLDLHFSGKVAASIR
ncbi:hypothetical protein BKA70DRAFT_1483777 [Coprinopsis sp. MPI-PUGE-AT-0042]|nr:hypothetical protein BKA70DRAFT_1483777 [Coprinopsis sp. MPI-PUGE-AT-0042]